MLPIRIEATRMDNQTTELKNNAIWVVKKRAKLLLGSFVLNIFISILLSMFPGAKAMLNIILQLSGILFIIFFVRAGFALAILFITKTKDFSGGYIEVYNDHIVVKQRTRYVNSSEWENAEIWFEDLIKMWNSTQKSSRKIYRYHLQFNEKNYIEEICFRFKTGSKSHAKMTIITKGDTFGLHFGGYSKEELLNLGKIIHSRALAFNTNLIYEEEPIIYKRVLRKITRN